VTEKKRKKIKVVHFQSEGRHKRGRLTRSRRTRRGDLVHKFKAERSPPRKNIYGGKNLGGKVPRVGRGRGLLVRGGRLSWRGGKWGGTKLVGKGDGGRRRGVGDEGDNREK